MTVKCFVVGSLSTNCYVVENEAANKCVIIDPGDYPAEMAGYIKSRALKVSAVLLTHGHFDHILGLDRVLEEFPVPVYAYEAEAALLSDKYLNLSAVFRRGYTFTRAKYVADNEVLELAGIKFKVIYTPGHTGGSCCYYVEDEGVLFSGDTLFKGAVGRVHFPTGSGQKLQASIRGRLFVLPDNTKVYPGHNAATDIGSEKKGYF